MNIEAVPIFSEICQREPSKNQAIISVAENKIEIIIPNLPETKSEKKPQNTTV